MIPVRPSSLLPPISLPSLLPNPASPSLVIKSNGNEKIMDTFRKQEALKPYFEESYGCAAFSSVAKAGIFFVGGAFGSGDVYKLTDGGTNHERVCGVDLMQAGGGFVLGGEVYAEIIFFRWETDFNAFIEGKVEFSADGQT
ncbi:hypothetical protein ACHAWF_011938 [Thalassiosira exigua]